MLLLERTINREATAEECPNGGTVYTYNHTWQEVHDALISGKAIAVKLSDIPGDPSITIDFPLQVTVASPSQFAENYYVAIESQNSCSLDADSADGYLYEINCNE